MRLPVPPDALHRASSRETITPMPRPELLAAREARHLLAEQVLGRLREDATEAADLALDLARAGDEPVDGVAAMSVGTSDRKA